jgi:pyridoxal 5'-phosphate synthase pdxT subunit
VLGLQGDVPEHLRAFDRILGVGAAMSVRTASELARVGALSMPGGESTTISKLLDDHSLRRPLAQRIAEGLPVLATCAGLILLSREIEPVGGSPEPSPIPVLDIVIRRNDYGRQRESFEGPVDVVGLRGRPFPGVFIRAPRILERRGSTEVLATRGDELVGVRKGAVWGLTFHPELSGDERLFRLFLEEAVPGPPARRPRYAGSARTARRR